MKTKTLVWPAIFLAGGVILVTSMNAIEQRRFTADVQRLSDRARNLAEKLDQPVPTADRPKPDQSFASCLRCPETPNQVLQADHTSSEHLDCCAFRIEPRLDFMSTAAPRTDIRQESRIEAPYGQ